MNLFRRWRENDSRHKIGWRENINFLSKYVTDMLGLDEGNIAEEPPRGKLKRFCAALQRKWSSASANEKTFLAKNLDWLQRERLIDFEPSKSNPRPA